MTSPLAPTRPAWYSPYRFLSPGGAGGKLSIFIFHRVMLRHDPLLPYEPTVQEFDWMIGFIARHFRVLPLDHAMRGLANNTLPNAAACITFDDGYADNHDLAMPVLRQHGATATFFITTDYIGDGRMWNDTVLESVRRLPDGPVDWRDLGLAPANLVDDESRRVAAHAMLHILKYLPPQDRELRANEIARRAGLPDALRLMMSQDQVRGMLAGGMSIGGHTLSHPILTKVSEAEARDEIAGGREVLKAWTGEAPTMFAYPDGIPVVDYTERDMRLVREAGFDAAFTTANGAALAGDDLLQMPRFTPWDRTVPRFAVRCGLNLHRRQPYARVASGSAG